MKQNINYLKWTFILSIKQIIVYPSTFWIVALVVPLYSLVQIIFLETIYGQTNNFLGYTKYEAFILFGTFTIVQTIGHLLFHWRLSDLKALVRGDSQESFDITLTKPIDSQVSATLGKFNFGNIAPFFVSTLLVVYGVVQGSIVLNTLNVSFYFLIILLGVALFYLTLLFMSTFLFWFPDLQTVEALWESFMDFGKYPAGLYRGIVGGLFNIVIPITLMGAIPVEFLLGKKPFFLFFMYFAIVLIIFCLTRLFWIQAVKKYSSFSS